MAARTNTNEFSKKRSRSQDDQKENNTLNVLFNEVFGREDVAKGNILWHFIRRKTIQLRLCNISFPSRSRGYEKTVIQLTLSGENRNKIPERFYHVKTSRPSSYNVNHGDQHVIKFVTPLVNNMMTEIHSKTGDNENLKDKYILKAIDSLKGNFKSKGKKKSDIINSAIVK